MGGWNQSSEPHRRKRVAGFWVQYEQVTTSDPGALIVNNKVNKKSSDEGDANNLKGRKQLKGTPTAHWGTDNRGIIVTISTIN